MPPNQSLEPFTGRFAALEEHQAPANNMRDERSSQAHRPGVLREDERSAGRTVQSSSPSRRPSGGRTVPCRSAPGMNDPVKRDERCVAALRVAPCKGREAQSR
jgi:hypothetical protein